MRRISRIDARLLILRTMRRICFPGRDDRPASACGVQIALLPSPRRISSNRRKGKPIVTLKDAVAYIMKLPTAQQQSPRMAGGRWEAVIIAAEDREPLMHAHVGMMRALNHGIERVFSGSKETHWARRKLARRQRG